MDENEQIYFSVVHRHFDFQNLCKSAEAVSPLVNHSDLFKTYANQLKLYPHWSVILIIQYKFGYKFGHASLTLCTVKPIKLITSAR